MIIDKPKIYLNQLAELKDLNIIKKQMGLKLPLVKLGSANLIINEDKLVHINRLIRKTWIKEVGINNSQVYKSTLWGTNVKDLQKFKYHFSYETLLNDENNFSDLLGYSLKGLLNKTFLFSSGMNAIANIFYCLSSFLKGPLNIQASVGYFETKYFLKLINSMGNKVKFNFEKNFL